MKLSMWILAEWLAAFEPRVIISKGEADIAGVRIVEERISPFSHEHLYIARVSESSSDIRHAETIMLTHGDDHIFISNSDSETLINEVLAAFDYYDQWEASLREASRGDDALQRMIVLSDEVFGFPSRIMDADGRILAISEKFGPDDVDARWKKIYETRVVQLHSVGLPVITLEGEYLPEWEEIPRRYYTEGGDFHYIAANITVDDEVLAAFLMEEFGRPLTLAQCQLAAVFCTVLRSALEMREADHQYSLLKSKPAMLLELLEGKALDSDSADYADYAEKLAFAEGDAGYLLIAIRNILDSTPIIRTRSMLAEIRALETTNITVEFDNDIVSVIRADQKNAFLDALLALINPVYYLVGVSHPFEGWNSIPLHFRQANFAINMGGGVAGVYRAEDFAYKHLIRSIADQNSEWEFCHPGVLALKRYDERQKTEFFETLHQFIVNERSLVETARALHIHRNTLIYRIRRINELLDIDLADPDERAFILLSYELLKSL